MVKLADTRDLKSLDESHEGSIPSAPISPNGESCQNCGVIWEVFFDLPINGNVNYGKPLILGETFYCNQCKQVYVVKEDGPFMVKDFIYEGEY